MNADHIGVKFGDVNIDGDPHDGQGKGRGCIGQPLYCRHTLFKALCHGVRISNPPIGCVSDLPSVPKFSELIGITVEKFVYKIVKSKCFCKKRNAGGKSHKKKVRQTDFHYDIYLKIWCVLYLRILFQEGSRLLGYERGINL